MATWQITRGRSPNPTPYLFSTFQEIKTFLLQDWMRRQGFWCAERMYSTPRFLGKFHHDLTVLPHWELCFFFFSRGIIPFYGRTLQVKYCHLPRYLMIFESSIHMAVQRLMCRGGLCARAGQVEIKVGEWQGISHGNSWFNLQASFSFFFVFFFFFRW